MNQLPPKFKEEYSAKLPALVLLTSMGWSFLTPAEALAARNGKYDEVVLRNELRSQLAKRRFSFAGKTYPLSEKSIDNLINQVCSPALNEGLKTANEKLYNHLLYGISVTEFVGNKRVSTTVALIDWHNKANNSFLFTEEFTVARSSGVGHRRPDIVCFVNGIPLAVIEAKRPDSHAKKGPTIDEGVSQSLRNQQVDEIPRLFAYNQLLLSINGIDGRYATCGTPQKFWAVWSEEDISHAQMYALKNKDLSSDQVNALFTHRKAEYLEWYKAWRAGGELAVSGQDKLLISLLSPARLLEMTRLFTLFDKKIGKLVARYQQVFGIKRLIERISQKRSDGGREGGVIWHTTGSGKSFTMVMLSRALLMVDELKKCRIFVVTDRTDLETQISNTFASGGELSGKDDHKLAMATSGHRLAKQISKGTERIIFSLIHKFNSATRLPECVNTSADIIVLVDEGHRSQGGENNIRMQQALPNAAFVAFTGTPLLKDDKTTNKFGPIVHAYTMQRAVEDGTVTPLLYEERKPDLDTHSRAVDKGFERITAGLSQEQTTDLKRKFTQKGLIYQSDNRIEIIAQDIADHFSKNIKDNLRGQLACDSKTSAIKYKKYLDKAGLFESAIVMSPPDTREGNTDTEEESMPEISQWWKKNVGTTDEKVYTRQLVERFASEGDLKMLIVVDKLLTGFDEPKNTVLYIDKPLKGHNLIQAIARVNRLHPDKDFGLLIDYRGILAELDTTIAKYQDLAARTQGGYDIDDLTGLYRAMSTEYKRLPQLYKNLWAIFKEVKNTHDHEQMRQVLVPKMEMRDGELVDVNLKVREDFYQALSEFATCMKVALQSATFFEDKTFSEADREHYKVTLREFISLRQSAKQDAGETVDYDKYADEIKKLLDKHVIGVEVREPDGVYEVNKMGKHTQPEEWSEDKTRNETDIIKTRVTKMIEQDLRDDPYAQQAFSALLLKAIEEVESLFDHPLKEYLLFSEFEDRVKARTLDTIPNLFHGNHHAQAYYGVFMKILPHVFAVNDEQVQVKWVGLAFKLDGLVERSVTENSINPQNIEADIRKKLLPMMFQECKAIGGGMDQAKSIVEMVVQITRVGLSGI